jgi:hypothetical protein
MADHRNAIDSETDHPAQEIARGELSEILDLELSRLPTQFQTPVVLCDLEGLTHREAAQRLGIASSTLQDHLAKGRRLLRDRFVRRGVTLSLGALVASQAQHVLSEERISAISSKALLFALGKSASEICVSSLAFQTANKVTATMMKTRTLTLCCAALTLIMLFGPISALTGIGPAAGWLRADDLLFDDFTSPNPTSLNREPIRWLPDPGRLSIVDGSLHIAGAGQFSRAVTSGFDHADVSVRTLFRDGHNASPWIQARFRKNLQPADTGYFAGLLTDGTAFIGITGGNPREIVSVPTDVDPTRESVLLQFDALGDELTLYAWRADEPFPAEPTVSFDGATLLHSGEIALGIGAGNQSLAHSGNFDFVRVAPYSIPEPSTALLAGAGLAGLLYVSRRAHLPQCFS